MLSELDATDDTLPLRLLGAGTTLRHALIALSDRPDAIPHGAEILTAMLRLRPASHPSSSAQESAMLNPTDAAIVGEYINELFREEGREQARAEALATATLHALVLVVERRLRRPLTDPERDALRTHLERDGDRTFDTAVDAAPDALAAWLAPAP